MPEKHALTVHLMDLYTGETREYNDEWSIMPDYDGKPWWYYAEFQWFENNYSCDCNRWNFWEDSGATGRTDDMTHNNVCGEPRIRAKIIFPEPMGEVSDWPKDEQERMNMATELKKERAYLFDKWDKE